MFGSFTSVNACSMPGSASDGIGKDDSGSLPPSHSGSIKGSASNGAGKDCCPCHSVHMPDFVKNVGGDDASAPSSSPQSGLIKGFADDETGKSVDDAHAIADPVRMPGFVKNEDGTGAGKAGPVSISGEAGHVHGLFGKDGPVLLPFNPTGTSKDPDWGSDDEMEDEAIIYQVPAAGDQRHTILASEVKFDPDYIQLATKMQKLTLQEVQAMNEDSGIFKMSMDQLDIPIGVIADFALGFIKQLNPLMIWQLVRNGDDDITTTALHPILHEQFMPQMRKRGNLSTHTLKNLKFALLESLVCFFKIAYSHNGNTSPLSDHSRFASRVASRIEYALREILVKGRIDHNRRIFAITDDVQRKRRDQHPSPTRNMEHDNKLSPKVKTEVFMNGVIERKRCGSMFSYCLGDQQKRVRKVEIHFEDLIQLRPGDRQHVLDLFEFEEGMSAGDLLNIFDECLEVYQSGLYSQGFKKTLFYAHRGARISFLCDHLNAIRNDLESDEWMVASASVYWLL